MPFRGRDCTFGQEQGDRSGGEQGGLHCILTSLAAGRQQRPADGGRRLRSIRRGRFPPSLLRTAGDALRHRPPPPRHRGEGKLCSRAGFLYASRNHRLFLSVSPEGLVTHGLRRRVRAPEEDALPQEGTAPGNIPAEPKRSAPLPSGKGTSENENILVDCFSKRCKTVNIYMEIWVLNNC